MYNREVKHTTQGNENGYQRFQILCSPTRYRQQVLCRDEGRCGSHFKKFGLSCEKSQETRLTTPMITV